MAHLGIMTNGLFSVQEEDIYHVVEVKDLRTDIVAIAVLDVEIGLEPELRCDVVQEFVLEARVVESC